MRKSRDNCPSQLRKLVAQYGTQAALVRAINIQLESDEAHISASQISAAINGHHPLGLKLQRKIEKALHLPPSWLADGDGPPDHLAMIKGFTQTDQDIVLAMRSLTVGQRHAVWAVISEFAAINAPKMAKMINPPRQKRKPITNR